MNILKVGAFFGGSTMIKMLSNLLVIKLAAHYLGVEGMGYLGQFMGVVALATLLAGGGTSVGLTKYVAEFKASDRDLQPYLHAAFSIWAVFSVVFFLVLAIGAKAVSRLLFDTEAYYLPLVGLGLCQAFIGINNLALAVINGHRDVKSHALVTVATVVVGSALIAILLVRFGTSGAIWGLILSPTIGSLFALGVAVKKRYISSAMRASPVERLHYLRLIKFGSMYFVSAITMPLALIYLRNLQGDALGWGAVGIWQGLIKVSDAYLQVFMVILASYYMPRLSAMADAKALIDEVKRMFLLIGLLMIIAIALIYLCRRLVIAVLFTDEFAGMAELFWPQLLGDLCKTLAYVLGYIVVAKAKTRIYMAAEVIQAGLLVFFSQLLLARFGALAVPYAYLATYAIYLVLALACFRVYINQHSHQQ